MTRTTTPDNTGLPHHPQENAYIIGVNLVVPGGEVKGEITLPRRLGEVIDTIIRHLTPEQDTRREPVKLSEFVSSPQALRAQSENRREGRLMATATRRAQRQGRSREDALRAAAEARSRTFSEAEVLVKLHNRARAQRIEKLRVGIISRGRRAGLSHRDLAERLHVTPQHVGRLVAGLQAGVSQ